MPETVGFTQMKDGTQEDYALLARLEEQFARTLPERVLAALGALDQSLAGYPVSRLEHSLQCATRARRDGADEDLVVGALLHDVGDLLAPYNHAEYAASLVRPYLRADVTWIVEQHGLFQSYYYAHHYGRDRHARERLRSHPWFDRCAHFCEQYDQSSFDPAYPSAPLDEFEPLVRRVFTRPPHNPGVPA